MSIKFSCIHCGHRLKATSQQAGKGCKCSRCGHPMTAPGPVIRPTALVGSPTVTGHGKKWVRRATGAGIAAAVLAGGIVLAVVLYGRNHVVEQKLQDLGGDVPAARSAALLWLAEADTQTPRRAQVTATLEPLVFEGDVRETLDPDLVLRAYLHWANQDNVPSLIRMVEKQTIPAWNSHKTELVMDTLGRLQDPRAADVLARKLHDPQLHDQAVDSLKLLGPCAENAVLDCLFADDQATQQRAGELLATYGTKPSVVIAEARRRLQSNDPEDRRSAAAWFATNAPEDEDDKNEIGRSLAAMLGDLSPELNGLALQGLKLWATKDCLPQVVEFAGRQQKAGNGKTAAANNAILIDVLAQFPEETAAEAIALQLKDPEQRGKAAQALLKFGPVAAGSVLQYLDHPDEGVRKEARNLCRVLKVSADRQLEQTLADAADTSKARSRIALQSLAQLRPDDTARVKVSRSLNAPLLDPDPAVRAYALDAVRVWATLENTTTLLKLLGNMRMGKMEGNDHDGERIVQALISIGPEVQKEVVPLLKSPDGLLRRQSCWILSEVGTSESLQPLEDAGKAFLTVDNEFYEQTQRAIAKIMARK